MAAAIAKNPAAGRPVQVVLVANYQGDRQQSMLRFAGVLECELRHAGVNVSMLAPRVIVGGSRNADGGVGKWLGYVDKYLLFPWTLRSTVARLRRSGANVVVHVCDHSNAMYTRHLRDVPHLVTCNDLLAVRSALGEIPQNRTRWSGRLLQRWILAGLRRAQQIACISNATREDVLRLTGHAAGTVHLVYMGLNHPYKPIDEDESRDRLSRVLSKTSMLGRQFILHVGGNQWYKNRLGVLEIYAELRRPAGSGVPALVMVGEPFTAIMRRFVEENGLGSDVAELTGVTSDDLAALYSRAELLMYPSLAEGFGWPVAEAMACGCRVITSDKAPLTEIGGSAAAYADPQDVSTFAQAIRAMLGEPAPARHARVEQGLHQSRQFSTEAMMRRYIDLYDHLAASQTSGGPALVPGL